MCIRDRGRHLKKSPPRIFRLGVSFRQNALKGAEEIGQLGHQVQKIAEGDNAQEGVERDRVKPARFGGAKMCIRDSS